METIILDGNSLTIEEIMAVARHKAEVALAPSAVDAIHREGYDAGYQAALEQARAVFEKVVLAKYGAMPPALSARIAQASFADMERWVARMPSARHVTALIV